MKKVIGLLLIFGIVGIAGAVSREDYRNDYAADAAAGACYTRPAGDPDCAYLTN